MIARVVAWSGRHPIRVLAAASFLAGVSIFGQRALSRDVLPDLSDPQVVVVADWMGHPAMDVADQVTRPLTEALQGVPGATAIRGESMSGMAYLDVIFKSTSAVAGGRVEILARVDKARARLPATARVQVGPEASSTGWVYQYALMPPDKTRAMPMGARRPDKGPTSLFGLRRFQDDVLRPKLAAIPGVAEVASLGGDTEEMSIETTPDQLRAAGVAYSDVVATTRAAMARPAATIEQVQAAPLGGATLSRVAQIRVGPAMANGMADVDGARAAVAGIVIAKREANVEEVLRKVRAVIEHERTQLPPGAQLGVVYDRSELGERVQQTLYRAVGEEIAVVALVVLLFLLHLRSAAIPILTLPLVVLLTFVSMRVLGVPATIMSLGGIAIALGMAVDADLVALEACHRRLEAVPPGRSGESRRAALIAAAGSFAPAILTSLVIAALAFIPVFAFGGESGRLLRPLAITKTLVIAAAALITLTVAPALRDRLVRGKMVPEMANPLTRMLVRGYRPFVHFALSRPGFTLATAGLAAVSCLPIATHLGGEFLPRIDEGTLFYMPTTAPGISPDEASSDMARQDEAIAAHKEVALVFGKAGRAETATDPAPFSMVETTIRLKPRAEWPNVAHRRWYSRWAGPRVKRLLGLVWPEETPATTAELVQRLDRTTRFAGWTNGWTAPIRARLDMMSTGVRTPVGVRIVTDDHTRLDALGAAVRAAVLKVPGTKNAVYEGLGGETRLAFAPDGAAMARHQVDPALVRATADLFITGGRLGQMRVAQVPLDNPVLIPAQVTAAYAGQALAHAHRHEPASTDAAATPLPPANAEHGVSGGSAADRAPVPVRISLAARWHPKPPDQLLREVTVRGGAGDGQPVPLALLGRPTFVSAPAQLRTERGSPVGYVYVNLEEGTDVATYVDQARALVAGALASGEPRLRPNERLEWTGQYELMIAGQNRLKVIAPIVVLLMLGLLLLQFRSLTQALIVLVAVPFALVGSVWTLYFLGYKLSAPVWVGLLSVVGLAMQTGVVMVVYIDDAFHRRLREGLIRSRSDIVAAHAEGTVLRLRPKIMTITTMAAALLPLLWAQGAGSEVMKRVAAPMLGGLITSAFLTLEVIPVLYTIWRHQQLKRAMRAGQTLEQVLTPAPAWAHREAA